MSYKNHRWLSDDTELLIGQDINGIWTVSHWDSEAELISSKQFNTENEAIEYFNKNEDEL